VDAWLAAGAVVLGLLLALVGYVWIGVRRIEALNRLYAHRPTLLGALQAVGGARRPPGGDLALAREVSDALGMDGSFESCIQGGLLSNFTIVGQPATDQFRQQLTALAEEEAERAKPGYLNDAALFFHATLSDAEMKQFIADPARIKRSHIRHGTSSLVVRTTAQCVGEARRRLRELEQ
jgi:hypothetical protein